MQTTPNHARRTSEADSSKAVIPEHAKPLLDRLVRLRVCTASQAHLLTPAFASHSLRNAYHRLSVLVRNGWLVMDAVAPQRGASAPRYYRPSHRALRAMQLEKRVGLLQRPAQHVLEYLLFRTEVYARARAAGWWVGSSTFLAPAAAGRALETLHSFLKARALARFRAAEAKRLPAPIAEARTALEQLPAFLPAKLDFEFLYRVDAKNRPSHVVLLLVDDVRRSVVSQVDALPLVARHDCGILIRDCDSVWNPDTRSLHFTGARLVDLRRGVSSRLGAPLLDTDVELPSVWARFTRPPQHDLPATPTTQQETP